jgi:hypothetical protein
MDRKLHLLESFAAKGSDGVMYKVLGFEHLVRDSTTTAGLDNWEPSGFSEWRLADGRPVSEDQDGRFRIEGSDVQLSR